MGAGNSGLEMEAALRNGRYTPVRVFVRIGGAPMPCAGRAHGGRFTDGIHWESALAG